MAAIRPELIQSGASIRIHLPAKAGSIEITGKAKPFVSHKIGSVELDINGWLMGGCRLGGNESESAVNGNESESAVNDNESESAVNDDADTVIDFLSGFLGTGSKRFGLVKLDVGNAVARGYTYSAAMPPGPRRVAHQFGMAGVASDFDCATLHDVAPMMVTTTGSLEELNRNLVANGSPTVGMDRMRANIVIRGVASLLPGDEEFWARATFEGGQGAQGAQGAQGGQGGHRPPVAVRFLQGCVRCTVPSIDQKTGGRPDGQNPVKVLKQTNMRSPKTHGPYASMGPVFGTYAAVEEGCEDRVVRVGDRIDVTMRDATSPYALWLRLSGLFGQPLRSRWVFVAAAAGISTLALLRSAGGMGR
jgi:hypothetical protein